MQVLSGTVICVWITCYPVWGRFENVSHERSLGDIFERNILHWVLTYLYLFSYYFLTWMSEHLWKRDSSEEKTCPEMTAHTKPSQMRSCAEVCTSAQLSQFSQPAVNYTRIIWGFDLQRADDNHSGLIESVPQVVVAIWLTKKWMRKMRLKSAAIAAYLDCNT